MKKLGSGKPIRSTTSRRTRNPSNATFSTATVAGISAREEYVESTLAVLGRIASGLRRSKRIAAFSTSAPAVSSRTLIRQLPSASSSRLRQSGAGTTSSSISHIASKPSSYAVLRPRWKPPAPPRLSAVRIVRRPGRVAAASTSGVWSVLALSTTITASGARSSAARPSSIRASRSARL